MALHRSWQADPVRDECLNEHLFQGLSAARRIVEAWRLDYSDDRPHTSLGGFTPNEFAARSRTDQNQNGFWLLSRARWGQGQHEPTISRAREVFWGVSCGASGPGFAGRRFGQQNSHGPSNYVVQLIEDANGFSTETDSAAST
jgi:hypothetical protein